MVTRSKTRPLEASQRSVTQGGYPGSWPLAAPAGNPLSWPLMQ